MLTALDHVVIAVRDLAAATRDYSALLGRRPSWRGHHPGLGTRNALFRLDNTYLELLAPEDPARPPPWLGAGPEGEAWGLFALAFRTSDAAECAATLRDAGIAVADPVMGEGAEAATGAVRRWRNLFLPPEATRGVPLFAIEHLSPSETLPDAPLAAPAASAIHALDHAVVMCADAEAALTLYGEKLGLRLALDRSFETRGLRLLFFRVGGVTVEIAVPLRAESDAPPRDRLYGLSWRVADVAAAHARLASAGFEVSELRAGMKPGTRVFTVRRETHGVATLVIGPDVAAPGSP